MTGRRATGHAAARQASDPALCLPEPSRSLLTRAHWRFRTRICSKQRKHPFLQRKSKQVSMSLAAGTESLYGNGSGFTFRVEHVLANVLQIFCAVFAAI